jgi:DUF1009 family protein
MSAEPGVGVVAGGGPLPRLIAEAQRDAGRSYLVIAFEGQAPDWLSEHPHAVVAFEKPGRVFRALRDAGVARVCFAGGLVRPKLRPLKFDRVAASLAPRILPLIGRGDDALLRALGDAFEAEGFALVPAHHLTPELLAPDGAFSAAAPSDADRADIDRAAELAALIGGADIGQAAVVAGGLCLGLETVQGTDALLRFVAATPERLRREGARGALYKGPKPGQDLRADLPAIGPETVARAAEARLAGVAVAAGRTLVFGLEETRRAADEAGLFLWGRSG